jgi:SAM-dependent methyltransferase
MDPKELVRKGYDEIAGAYAEWAARIASTERQRATEQLLATLPEGAAVLDLGCGNGLPTTAALARRFVVTGVDISAAQLERARANVPGARFVQGDMAVLDFPAGSFVAVIACYSVIHLPREEHLPLFERVAGWLAPGGWFMLSLAASASDAGVEPDWLGAPMYWSHYDAAGSRALLEQAGFEIVEAIPEALDEGTGHGVAHFVWFWARTPH